MVLVHIFDLSWIGILWQLHDNPAISVIWALAPSIVMSLSLSKTPTNTLVSSGAHLESQPTLVLGHVWIEQYYDFFISTCS